MTFVALHEAELHPRGVRVPYSKAKIAEAPKVNHGGHLSIAEEDALFDYYGVPIDADVASAAHPGTVLEPATGGHTDR